MTAIVGLVDSGTVYMGADSATTDINSYESKIRQNPKIAMVGDMIIGACGSPRIGQMLHHAFSPPAVPISIDLMCYMVTDFVDAVKLCFCNEMTRTDATAIDGSSIMVGVRGHLYCVHDDYQIEEVVNGYSAIGVGADLALGSMHTTRELIGELPSQSVMYPTPRDRIRMALEAAQEHNATVREPFTYLQVTT